MSLKKIKEELRERIEQRGVENVPDREDRRVQKEQTEMLSNTLSAVIDKTNQVGPDVESKLTKVMENTATIKFEMPAQPTPVVKVPEIKVPDIKVNVPPINIPEIKVPDIKLPEINIPKRDMDETNKLLKQLINETNKPCEINLILE